MIKISLLRLDLAIMSNARLLSLLLCLRLFNTHHHASWPVGGSLMLVLFGLAIIALLTTDSYWYAD